MTPLTHASVADRSALGTLLREWRQERRLSQLALALSAGVSQRHLSFVESGRAQPSREMVLLLAEHLDLPLRERNRLLLAAGFAPAYSERSWDDPALTAVRAAVDLVLAGHEPYPAIVVDRHWTLLAHNRAVGPLLRVVDASLLQPPVNVLRISLHPMGLAPHIENLAEWRAHLLERLRRQVATSADPVLANLHAELSGYPIPIGRSRMQTSLSHADVFVPMRLRTEAGTLSMLSTTTVFGTPVDVTVADLALECFYPADNETAELLRAMLAV